MPQPHLLMCSPKHFDIVYEINPWMSRQRRANPVLAMQQWRALEQMLLECGAKISLVAPQPDLPDLVFTANAAIVFQNTAVLAHFRHSQRQGEEQHFAARLGEAGFQVQTLPRTDLFFEGAGDALFCGDTLFAGYRMRSDALAHQLIGEMLGVRVLPLELIDPYYYHLDTCFCPLTPDAALIYPPAFDTYGRRVLRESISQLIEVSPEEARRFACNAVVVGQTVLTNVGCPKLHASLRESGFEPRETPLDEFMKAGGSAKCLTLRLDGEDAANWKAGLS